MADSGFTGWDDYDEVAEAAAARAAKRKRQLQQHRSQNQSANLLSPGSQHSSGRSTPRGRGILHKLRTHTSPNHLTAATTTTTMIPTLSVQDNFLHTSPYYSRSNLHSRNNSNVKTRAYSPADSSHSRPRRHSHVAFRGSLSEQAVLMTTTVTPTELPPIVDESDDVQQRPRTQSSAATSQNRRASSFSVAAVKQYLSISSLFGTAAGGAIESGDSGRRASAMSHTSYRQYNQTKQNETHSFNAPVATITPSSPLITRFDEALETARKEEVKNEIVEAGLESPALLAEADRNYRPAASPGRQSIWSLNEARRRMSRAGSVWTKLMALVRSDEMEAMLDEEGELAMLSQYRPESIESLCAQTNFNATEVKTMYRGFKQECPNGHVDEDQFKDIFCQYFPEGDASNYAHYVFNTIDIGKRGYLNFGQFLVGLSILSRGSMEDKLAWCFNLYDINADGYITRDEMQIIVRSVYEMLGGGSFSLRSEVEQTLINQHVERVFHKMDLNRDGVVTKEEFVTTCLQDDIIRKSLLCFGSDSNG